MIKKYALLIALVLVISLSLSACSGIIDSITKISIDSNGLPAVQGSSSAVIIPERTPFIDNSRVVSTDYYIDLDAVLSIARDGAANNPDAYNSAKDYFFNRPLLAQYKNDDGLAQLCFEMYITILESSPGYTLAGNVSITSEQLSDLFTIILCSSPELIHINRTYQYTFSTDTGFISEVNFDYTKSKTEYCQNLSKLFEVMNQMLLHTADYSGYEKELYAHDLIINNCTYSKAGADVANAYGALIKGSALCEGYSNAFLLAMYCLKIPTIQVYGDAINQDGKTESHAWNLVKIDGEWYQMDVTWNDSAYLEEANSPITSLYAYFNITDGEIGVNHFMSELFTTLVGNSFICSSTRYNYYNINGTMLSQDSDSKDFLYAVANACQNQTDTATMYVKFDSKGTYDRIVNSLVDIAGEYNSSYAGDYAIKSFTYSYSQELLVICITFTLVAN